MNQFNPTPKRQRRRPYSGASLLELLVALTLLVSVMAVATPLVVHHGRLLASYRDYQCALEELTNQLDRLTALPASELDQALEHLAPSAFAAERLSGAELKAELASFEMGQRLTLRLTWDEPQRRAAPVCLTAWIISTSKPVDAGSAAEDRS